MDQLREKKKASGYHPVPLSLPSSIFHSRYQALLGNGWARDAALLH